MIINRKTYDATEMHSILFAEESIVRLSVMMSKMYTLVLTTEHKLVLNIRS